MISSSLITPVRWYTDIFESDRFSTDCDICPFELITDKTRLLPFQFKRDQSGYVLNQWFLRKQCNNPFVELLDNNDSLFTYDTGFWDATQFFFLNGKVVAPGNTISQLEKTGIFTIGKYYTIKIVVNEYLQADVVSVLRVRAHYSTAEFIHLNGTGTFTVTFLADSTDFTIEGLFGIAADHITIESIQIYEYKGFDVSIGDIGLPNTLVKMGNIGTKDVIQYCGGDLGLQIPCGKYYAIMEMTDSTVYYSELFVVKDFIPSQSPYTMLEWKNTCDLGDVTYQTIQGCAYFNRLYIENQMSNATYPVKESGTEDGNLDFNVMFQKWEKHSSLMVPKAPEFIVDALTAIQLHDTFNIVKSLRQKQFQTTSAISIKRVETELVPVFNECATNVNLQLTLNDKIVDSTCCENEEVSICQLCTETVVDINRLAGITFFGDIPGEDFNLFELTLETNDTVTEFANNTILVGYQFYIDGDVTLDYAIGDLVYIEVVGSDLNLGVHQLTAVQYDIGLDKTAIQWSAMDAEVIGVLTGDVKKVTYENITVENMLLCVTGLDKVYMNQGGEFWGPVPEIGNITEMGSKIDGYIYTITGNTYIATYLKVQVTIYDCATGIETVFMLDEIFASNIFNEFGIEVYSDSFGMEVPDCGTVSFKLQAFELNCDYGFSDSFEMNYNTNCWHEVFETWYDALVGDKPTFRLACAMNRLIQGLDDDGILGEFDLLHILGGLETTEQRVTPLISSSGLAFVPEGTYTWNNLGFAGNGTDGAVNLKWKAVTDGIKFTQNDASLGVLIDNNVGGNVCDIGIKDTGYLTNIFAENGSGQFVGALHDTANSFTETNSSSIGLYSIFRNSSTQVVPAKNGTLLTPVTATSQALIDVEFYLGARNFAGVIERHSSRRYQFVFIGSKTVDIALLNTRVQAYITDRGI